MTENEAFVNEFYEIVNKTIPITKICSGINKRRRELIEKINSTCKTIRGVTADMSPSGRFISDEIELCTRMKTDRRIKQSDGTVESVQAEVKTNLVLNHKGFNSLRVLDAPGTYTDDSTYANPIGSKMMLDLISDKTKMFSLLGELVKKNKKKASQRCMDLMKLGDDAIKLRDIGIVAQDKSLKVELDEPIEVDLIGIENDYISGEIAIGKDMFLVENIRLRSSSNTINLNGRDIKGNDLDRIISPTSLVDYTIFMQLISPLLKALDKLGEDIDKKEKELNVVVDSINTKLASHIVVFKLNKNWDAKMGSVYWGEKPYSY